MTPGSSWCCCPPRMRRGPGWISRPQQRFVSGGFRRYWERFDQLQGMLRSGQSMQVCVHWVSRAVPWDQVQRHVVSASTRAEVACSLEERRELAEIKAAYGAHPVRLLLILDIPLNILWGTQTHAWVAGCGVDRGGATILPCPLTEGDLGDGVPILPDHPRLNQQLALGTDSNLRISCLKRCVDWSTINAAERFVEARCVVGVMHQLKSCGTPPVPVDGLPLDFLSLDHLCPSTRCTIS